MTNNSSNTVAQTLSQAPHRTETSKDRPPYISQKEIFFFFFKLLQNQNNSDKPARIYNRGIFADKIQLAANIGQAWTGKEIAVICYRLAIYSKTLPPFDRVDLQTLIGNVSGFHEMIKTNCGKLNGQEAAKVLWAYGTFGIVLPVTTIDTLNKAVCHNDDMLSAQDTVEILWAYATLGVIPPKNTLDTLRKAVDYHAKTFCLPDTISTLVTYATLSAHQNNPDFMRSDFLTLIKDSALDTKGASLIRRQQKQVYDACQYFSYPSPVACPKEDNNPSRVEFTVAEAFKKAGYRLDMSGRHISSMGHDVDIAVLDKGHQIFIECDGPTHFLTSLANNNRKYNGNTVLQTRLIQQQAPHIQLIRVANVSMRYIETVPTVVKHHFDAVNHNRRAGEPLVVSLDTVQKQLGVDPFNHFMLHCA
ncbi:MAG: hypothetical protein V4621_04985 [Pseudomonadota bacterium]